jgi:hypothetical protein
VVKANLLLHPIRLRIIQAFLGDRALTTGQLATELPDVPPGSLYRHVGLLVSAGVLSVASEHRVRGAVERSYVLQVAAAEGDAAMSAEEHRRAFMAFVAGLLADFDRYLELGEPDLARDGAGYRMAALWLSDAELAELLRELATVLEPRMGNAAAPGRRRRIVAGTLMPVTAPAAARGRRPTRAR